MGSCLSQINIALDHATLIAALGMGITTMGGLLTYMTAVYFRLGRISKGIEGVEEKQTELVEQDRVSTTKLLDHEHRLSIIEVKIDANSTGE